MKKYNIYWFFSEYSPGGISFDLAPVDDCKWNDESDRYTYVAEVELPEINPKDVQDKAVMSVDAEIDKKHRELSKLQDKKQQLLAIEFKGDE